MSLPSPESVGLGGQRTTGGLTYQVVAGSQGQLAWDAVTTGTHGRRIEALEGLTSEEAVRAALDAGDSTIVLGNNLTLTSQLVLPVDVSLHGPESICTIDATALSGNAIVQEGSVRSSHQLTSTASLQTSELQLNNVTGIVVGDVVRIRSNVANSWSGTWGAANRDYRKQNIRRVVEVSGNSVYLSQPLSSAFTTAEAEVDVLTTTKATHKNLDIRLSDTNNSRGMRVLYGKSTCFAKVSTNGGEVLGVELADCIDTLVGGADSTLSAPATSTQYTIAVSSCNNTVIQDSTLRSTRHAVAIVGTYQCENTRVYSSELYGSFPADAHGNADGYLYEDCGIHGDNGIKIGGRNGEWKNCRVTSKNGTVIAAIEVHSGTFKIHGGTTISSLSSSTFGVGWSPVDLGRGTGSITTDSQGDITFIFDDVKFNLPNLNTFFMRAQNLSAYKVNFRLDNIEVDYPSMESFLRYEGTPTGDDADFVDFGNNIHHNAINPIQYFKQGTGASGYATTEITLPLKQFLRPNLDGTSAVLGEFGLLESSTASPFDQVFGVQGTASSAGRVTLRANARFGDVRVKIGFDGSAQPERDVWEFTTAGNFQPSSDNAYSIGTASFRPSEIFAANSTINTSDERLKTPIERISDKELACAKELKQNYGKFKWLASVERERNGGSKARIHFGVGAQTVGKIFKKHGLNPDDYAVFCYDKWEDIIDRRVIEVDGKEVLEEFVRTPAGDIYGVRLEQLNAFCLMALQ